MIQCKLRKGWVSITTSLLLDVLTPPRSYINVGSTKPLLKLGHRGVITYKFFTGMYLRNHGIIPMIWSISLFVQKNPHAFHVNSTICLREDDWNLFWIVSCNRTIRILVDLQLKSQWISGGNSLPQLVHCRASHRSRPFQQRYLGTRASEPALA